MGNQDLKIPLIFGGVFALALVGFLLFSSQQTKPPEQAAVSPATAPTAEPQSLPPVEVPPIIQR